MTTHEPPPPAADVGRWAAIFDLDGVITDTTALHFQSWQQLAGELGIPFSRAINDEMRGLSRPESLAILLRDCPERFDEDQQTDLLRRKNEAYLALVAKMTPADLLPGAADLLRGLRAAGIRVAIASSSRNAGIVVRQLQLEPLLDAIVDANAAPRSKPDPQVFQAAADLLGMPAKRCVVVEDAEAGVAAGLAAGMRVIGIGPADRVGRADRVVGSIAEIDVALVQATLAG